MTNAEEIKKHIEMITETYKRDSMITYQDIEWCIEQLKASLEREEKLQKEHDYFKNGYINTALENTKLRSSDCIDPRIYEDRLKEIDSLKDHMKSLIEINKLAEIDLDARATSLKLIVKERDNLINLRKQDIELLHKTENELDDYREALACNAYISGPNCGICEACILLAKYPKDNR